MLTTAHELWALRYPETHDLLFLERPAGGQQGDRQLDAASAAGAVRVRSAHLSHHPSVIVASEAMDEEPAWTHLVPGELLHVAPDLSVRRELILDTPPTRPLSLEELDPKATASQPTPRPVRD